MKNIYKQFFLTFSFVLAGFVAFAQPTFQINNIKDPCNGLVNGSFEVLVTDGEPDFSLVVFGPGVFINNVAIEKGVPYLVENLRPGGFDVYVVDKNSNSSYKRVELTATSNISIDSYSLDHNSCQSSTPDGSITLTVSGGTGNYQYSLDGGTSFVAHPISNLKGGNYTVTVFDAGTHCSEEITLTIENELTITTKNPAPVCSNEGVINLLDYASPSVAGGNFTFTGDGVTGNNFDPSAVTLSGASTVVTIDVAYELNGCSDSGTISIEVKQAPKKPSVGAIAPVCQNADAPAIDLTGENVLIYSDAALTTQVGSGNSFDPDQDPAFSTAAAKTFTYYVTQQVAGCTSEAASFEVTVLANPKALTISGNTTVCEGQVGVLYEVPLTAGSSYSWTVPAGASILSGASGPENNRIYVTFGTTGGDITVVETTSSGCKGEPGSLAVKVEAKPAVFTLSAKGTTTICENETGPELVLSGSENGVSYVLVRNTDTVVRTLEGTGEALSFGTQNIAADYRVLASKPELAGCSQLMDGVVTISVNPLPAVSLEAFDAVCEDADAFELSGGSPAGGTYSGPGVDSSTGIFTPSIAGDGTHTITYTYQDGNSCEATAEASITVHPLPTVSLAAFEAVCVEDEAFALTGGSPVGGTYSGPGVDSNTGIFSPATAGEGTHTITYSYTDGNGCTAETSASLTVNPLPTVSLATFEAVCEDADAFALTGGTPAGGTYSGPGVDSSTGIFTPSIAGDGTHTITYTYQDGNSCEATAEASITVYPLPTVSLAAFEAVCVEDEAFALTGGSPVGGTYSGAGVSNGMFSPETAGVGTHTIVYTYQDANNCEASAENTITVNPMLAPELALEASATAVCTEETVTFTAKVKNEGTGATYNWYLNNVLVANNNQPTYSFLPSNGDQVYLEFTQGTLACGTGETVTSATETITVHPLPTVTLAEDATICAGSSAKLTFAFTGSETFTVTYTDGSQAFTETTTENPLVVSVSPTATTTYTILSIADKFCSQEVSGQAVTITVEESLAPAVEISPLAAEVCAESELTFTVSPTNPGANPTYQWFVNNQPMAGNNQATYTYVPQDGDQVYVELTQGTLACGAGGKVSSEVASVKVTPIPDASFDGPATVCLAEVPVSYSPKTAGGIFTADVADVITEGGIFSPKTAGTYTIYYSITTGGCSSVEAMQVQVDPVDVLSVELSVDQQEACGESNEFVFSANITNGGTSPQISWFVNGEEQVGENATTFTATNLSPETYEVSIRVVQDAASLSCPDGGTVSDSEIIRVNSSPLATLGTTDATEICAGETVNLVFTFNGTAPFSLSYTNGTETVSLSGIEENSLTVSVQPTESEKYSIVSFSDAGSCTAGFSGEVNISVKPVPAAAPENLQATRIACSEISVRWDGVLNSQGYQVRWSEDPTFASGVETASTLETTATISGLSGGSTYYIEVTAFNDCGLATESAVINVSLPETSAAPTNIAVSSESCDGFTVSWDEAKSAESYELDLATDETFENLVPGYQSFSTTNTTEVLSGLEPKIYYLRLRTVENCGMSQNSETVRVDLSRFVITGLTETIENVKCAGDETGSISVAVEGGVGEFSFLWSTGETTQLIENKPAGSYWVEVSSPSGCSLRETFQISEPQQISLEETIENVKCFGESTGAISLNVSGGTGKYTFEWSTGETTASISGLAAGEYAVTVTDANLCSVTETYTITAPDASLTLEAVVTEPSCTGAKDGAIDLRVEGGTASYAYLWSNGAESEDLTGLAAGRYEVLVRDANGCEIRKAFTLSAPVVLDLSMNISDATSCNVSDGSLSVDVSGGSGDYTYLWSTGETTSAIANLAPGTYSVKVTDAEGCFAEASATVSSPDGIGSLDALVTDADCNENNGSVSLTVNGGTAPYSYLWSNGAATQEITDLAAGIYDVSVTDANGCTIAASYTVNGGGNFTEDAVVSNASCADGNDGAIDFILSGGVAPYTYSWSNGAETEDVTGLSRGKYYVVVTDANGCSQVFEYFISSPEPIQLAASSIQHVSCAGGSDGAISFMVSGGTGNYTYTWSDGTVIQEQDLSGLSAGTYKIVITDDSGCTLEETFTLTAPEALTVSAELTHTTCGEANGAIKLTVGGGTGPYKFLWSNAAESKDLEGLDAGEYTVLITDANGCTLEGTYTIEAGEGIILSADVTEVSCTGDQNDGAINLNVSGGTGEYTFSWDNGAETEDLTNLSVGTYTVTVSDGKCSATKSFEVTPAGLVVDLGADIVRCDPAEVVLDAGFEPADGYTINWVGVGADTRTITVTESGNYTVKVINNETGCEDTDEVLVTIGDSFTSGVQIQALSEPSCGTEELVLDAEVTNYGENPQFSWSLNGVVLEGETARTLRLASYSDQDLVTVVVDVDLACATEQQVSASFTIEVPVLEAPVLAISSELVCEGSENPTFTASNVVEGASLRWYLGSVAEENLVAESTELIYTPEVTAAGSYTYFVTQTSERCGTSEAVSQSFTISNEGDCTPPACEVTPAAAIVVTPGPVLCADITTISLRADAQHVGENATFTWFHQEVEIGSGIELTYTPEAGFADGDAIQLLVQIVDEAYICNGVDQLTESTTIFVQEEVQATASINPVEPVCLESGGKLRLTVDGTYIDWREQGLSTTYLWYINGVLQREAILAPGDNPDVVSFSMDVATITEGTVVSLEVKLDESLACVLAPAKVDYTIPIAQPVAPEVSLTSPGAEGVCEGTEIRFTASATNAGENPVFVWFVQQAGAAEPLEVQRGLSNTYTYANAAADDQIWVRVEVANAEGLCLSSMEDTSAAYTVVLKSEADCADGGGDGGSNCNVFAANLLEVVEPSCDRENGELLYEVSGGKAPYFVRYTFAGQSLEQTKDTETFQLHMLNLPANETITVYIQDANGNKCSLENILEMAPRVSATLTKMDGGDVTCYGELMGQARLEIVGGNAPFEYKLSDEEGWVVLNGRTKDFTTLPAGINSILVRDNEGDQCFGEAEVEILSLYPKLEVVRFETEQANCNDNIGKIRIQEIAGGNGGPYKIKLQNQDNFRDFDPEVAFEGLSRGLHTVVISDGTCQITKEIRVGSPGLIAIDYSTLAYDCEKPGLKGGLYAKILAELTEVAGPYEASILKRNEAGEYVVVPGLEAVRFTQNEMYQYGLDNGTYAIEVRTVDREGCPENIKGIVLNDAIMPVPITFTHAAQNIYCVDEVGGVSITNLSGMANKAYIIQVYSNEQLLKERTIANDEYVVNNGVNGVYTISGLEKGIYRIVVSQEQGGCEGLEASEPASFKIEKKTQMLKAEVVSKTESFPERGSGTLSLAVQTNSGEAPYLSSIYLVEPLFPGQSYASEGDTVKYDPIEATFGFTYTHLPAGKYELYITDANGCSVIIEETIAHDKRIFIPNLITPNNDGYNEEFYVRNIPPTGTRLIITNRWGKVVYQTQNYANDWNGGDLPDGIYFYHLLVVGGEGIDMKGWLEIRRGSRP